MVYMANTSTKCVPFIKTHVYKELIYRTKTARKHWIEGREKILNDHVDQTRHISVSISIYFVQKTITIQ